MRIADVFTTLAARLAKTSCGGSSGSASSPLLRCLRNVAMSGAGALLSASLEGKARMTARSWGLREAAPTNPPMSAASAPEVNGATASGDATQMSSPALMARVVTTPRPNFMPSAILTDPT